MTEPMIERRMEDKPMTATEVQLRMNNMAQREQAAVEALREDFRRAFLDPIIQKLMKRLNLGVG